MTRRRGLIIIAVLGVIVVALALLLANLLGSNSGSDSESAARMSSTPTPTTTSTQTGDPAEVLEAVGIDVVQPPPVPEAPESWGDYDLERQWSVRIRIIRDAADEPVEGPDQDRFPATMNSCGATTYLVTFQTAAEGTAVDARLVDAAGDPRASEELAEGWMLGTNCVTPTFAPAGSDDGADPVDVEYTVHEYMRTPVAQEPVPGQPTRQPTQHVRPGPTFV